MIPGECNFLQRTRFLCFFCGNLPEIWISEKKLLKTHTPHLLESSRIARGQFGPFGVESARRLGDLAVQFSTLSIGKSLSRAHVPVSAPACTTRGANAIRIGARNRAFNRAANLVHDLKFFFSLGSVMPPCALYRDLTDEALWTVSRPACRVDGMPQPNRWSARTPGRKHRRPGR